jgi:hypothetical protein
LIAACRHFGIHFSKSAFDSKSGDLTYVFVPKGVFATVAEICDWLLVAKLFKQVAT